MTKQDEPFFLRKVLFLWKQRRDDHRSCQFDSWFSERISKSCHKLRELRLCDELSTKTQENLPTIRNPNSLHKYKSKYRSKISQGNVSPVDGPFRISWQGYTLQVGNIMLVKEVSNDSYLIPIFSNDVSFCSFQHQSSGEDETNYGDFRRVVGKRTLQGQRWAVKFWKYLYWYYHMTPD